MIVVAKGPIGMMDVITVVLVATITGLDDHQPPQDVVIIAGGRTLTTANVVAITTHSIANVHVLRRHLEDTGTKHTGVGAPAPMVVPAKGAITSTYLVAMEMTCLTFKFS